MQLARDAQSSGDPVLAENYLQHAEHYNRIIMTYREQQIQNGEVPSPQTQVGRFRPGGDDEFGDEEGGDDFGNMQPGGSQPMRQNDQQPRFEGGGQRYEERQPRSDRQDQPRHNRDRGEQRNFDRGGDRPDRGDRQDRGRTGQIVEAKTGVTGQSVSNAKIVANGRIGLNGSTVTIAATGRNG